jgi:hypothetical protein
MIAKRLINIDMKPKGVIFYGSETKRFYFEIRKEGKVI